MTPRTADCLPDLAAAIDQPFSPGDIGQFSHAENPARQKHSLDSSAWFFARVCRTRRRTSDASRRWSWRGIIITDSDNVNNPWQGTEGSVVKGKVKDVLAPLQQECEVLMIIVKGQTYNTVADAAESLGVSAKTIRDYIQRGIIPAPPEVKYGLRTMQYFPVEYLDRARAHLDKYRAKRKAAR
jgi:hypothetical protein